MDSSLCRSWNLLSSRILHQYRIGDKGTEDVNDLPKNPNVIPIHKLLVANETPNSSTAMPEQELCPTGNPQLNETTVLQEINL